MKEAAQKTKAQMIGYQNRPHNEIQWEGMDWINLVQVRDQWWALMNVVRTFELYKILGK
jgi:hypothetical protein